MKYKKYTPFLLSAIKFKCIGTPGHASLFLENTAIGKIRFLMEKFLEFRNTEEQRLKNTPELTIGDVTTVNITTIHGGIQQNVVPAEVTMTVDVRMSITMDHEQFERDVRDWCRQAGTDIHIEFIEKLHRVEPTRIDDSNPFWIAFKKTLVNDLYVINSFNGFMLEFIAWFMGCFTFFISRNHKIWPQIFPAATDSRHLREANIPVIGFSPMNHTPILLHEHDEFIKASTYIEGIEIYRKLLLELANL